MTETKSVYGPVKSWRLGRSLGIDLLSVDSICSFDCVYCQLGKINQLTSTRHVYVPTEKLIEELAASDWKSADVITISGSGEPTLASNLGEAIDAIRELTGKPIIVLTNSTMLADPQVRFEIAKADRIFCKLDAWSDEQLRRVNRPVDTLTHERIVDGIAALRREFRGTLAIQTMLLAPLKRVDIERFAKLLSRIGPDEVQLNVPARPVPSTWDIDNRGNRVEPDAGSRMMKVVPAADLLRLADSLEELTFLPVVTPPVRSARAAELGHS